VVKSNPQDFRRYKGGWISVKYPQKIKSNGTYCIKVSEFFDYIVNTNDEVEADSVRRQTPEINTLYQNETFLKVFMDLIEKNLADPDFDITTICKKLEISRSTLFRKMSELTGEGPHEFLQSFRLERAAQLLKENYGNVTEVSEAVGFSDQFHFSKCFKNKFHQSPKEYQLDHLHKPTGDSIIKERLMERSKENFSLKEPAAVYSITLYDRELVARGAHMMAAQQLFFNDMEGTPQSQVMNKQVREYYALHSTLNEALKHFESTELTQKIRLMIDTEKSKPCRNGIYGDDRLDLFDISDGRVHWNALSVAVVCMYWDLLPSGGGYFQLKTKNFGKVFNLHVSEPFYNQPVAAGPMCTGILVGKNVIATAAHFSNGKNVADLCFVFDFIMQDPISPVEQIPQDNIYKGVEILERVHNPEGDWMLVKLDRNVAGREVAVLSRRNIFYEQPVYVIGHPCGLPLKYAPGACVEEINDNYFRADLDVYSGNSGSPVFCAETHELIGIVSKGKATDFRWTEEGWITLRYPKTDPDYRGSQCSRTSDFEKLLK
jgi:AraC-like DNA-binding protein